MGNQNSRSTTPTSNPQSPTNTNNVTASHGPDRPHNHHPHHHHHLPHLHPPHSQHHSARRRESIQALSAAKAPAAPSVSLENAESHPTSARPISRGRAQAGGTSTKAVTTQLRAAQDLYNTTRAAADSMGNEQSSHKGHRDKDKHHVSPRDANTTPPSQPAAAAAIVPDTVAVQQQQQEQPAAAEAEMEATPEVPARSPSPSPTLPVDVPSSTSHPDPRAPSPSDLPSPTSASLTADYLLPASASQFSRPPRLPLPIEEEVHTPGSPIIAPQELAGFSGVDEIWTPVHESDADGMLPRRSSMVSSTTAGEDEDGDLGEEFKGGEGRPTVPTLIEWEGPGERVYVTGTFAGWNRKYKLHRNGPSRKKDALSAYVSVTPGTHHLTFLVDNDMRTSDKLPTAVDYTNILVNYIEVPYPELTPLPASPPAAAAANDPLDDSATPVQEREAPVGMYPPQVLPPSPPQNATTNPIPTVTAPPIEPNKPVVPEPTKKYHQNIPRYLLDLDAPEESSRFARANAMTNNLPTPPTLPGFLGKSILNGTTPMKDDSSVLIHPNHTVLNHLATSSIKDNILATSATTRYKQKFLTTIMYKPKEEGGEVY
ncbi:hypothetical protein ACET3X_008720 [Alternaria dauci]|uniref:Association with the SNF1 complex (ASC) domain-containing protein n=1 Tax=Alternaria dauci TaxID=48095 RepID=A0ABR3UCQ1_9PLEO